MANGNNNGKFHITVKKIKIDEAEKRRKRAKILEAILHSKNA